MVETESSLPSGRVEVSTPTINPISDSVRRALVSVLANVPGCLTALEQQAQRLGDAALVAPGIRAHSLARQEHEGVSHVYQGAHRTRDAFFWIHLVDSGRRKPRVGVRNGRLGQFVEQRLAVREVAVDRGPRDPGRGRHVVHARLLSRHHEYPCRAVQDGRGDALL